MKILRNNKKRVEGKKGIALFIAVIAVSAVLLLVLSIADISFKEQILTYSGKDSKVAFYAADSGLECALYHDVKKPDFYFATTSTSYFGQLVCNDQVVTPSITYDALERTATSTFSFNIDPGNSATKACSIVTVVKNLFGSDILTKVEARGYNNTCNIVQHTVDTGSRNLERSLEMTY